MCKNCGKDVPNAVSWGYELEVCEACCKRADTARRLDAWAADLAEHDWFNK